MFDWNSESEKAFGKEEVTPWIKLEDNVPFVGTVKQISGVRTDNFGQTVIEVWFHSADVPSGERNLNLGKTLAKEFKKNNVQNEDIVRILKYQELANDKNGNQLYELEKDGTEKLDAAGEKIPQSYTRYEFSVLGRGGKTASADVLDQPAKVAKKVAKPETDEIDISDIPF